ncbi:MAG: DUF1697 domain-containing protein [Saprospiraceae bacterium]|nr:DUF1697 domain-containing protein [Saprospiraceae bacterium]
MAIFIALLRGINVGGNTIFPMAELKAICEAAGFKNVRTYIQSGNVLFETELSEVEQVNILEDAIKTSKQKHIPVIIRSAAEMEAVLTRNPFPDALPAQVGVLFLVNKAPNDLFKDVIMEGREEVVVSGREIYIHFPDGMGRSKLKFPKAAQEGTMRNINTIVKLVKLAEQ